MKIISWNVNGLRAILKKGFIDFLNEEKPDVLCLQEIKIDREAIKLAQFDFPDYEEFYHPAQRKGYSGTAVLVNTSSPTPSPKYEKGLNSAKLLPSLKWDDEGRIIALDLGGFYLVNVYFPNANHELSRLDFKIDFNDKLLKYLKKLEKVKPVVLCGDLNVAHNEIDLARPKENVGNPGFHPRERAWMDKFIKAGFIDTFRELYPEEQKYSWWSYRAGARRRNVGWRIDYFCVSQGFMPMVKDAFIMTDVMGSDHCPIGITISD